MHVVTEGVIDARDRAHQRTRSRTQYNDLFDDRQRDLARAALEIWSEEGYVQVSVRNVARRTQLGHGLVHYYFKNKAALISACLQTFEDELVLRCRIDDVTDVPRLSHAVARAVTDSFDQVPHLHRVRYDLRHQAQYVPELQEHAARLDQVVHAWMAGIHHQYLQLGWHFDNRFELTAIQLDARLEHAVRGRYGGRPDDADPQTLYRDCLQILPPGSAAWHGDGEARWREPDQIAGA